MPRNKLLFCEKHQKDRVLIGKNKMSRCRDCFNEYRKEYISLNKEKHKEKIRIYNALTKERRQAWTAKNRKDSPERWRDYGKKYYALDDVLYNSKRLAKKYGLSLDEYYEIIKSCDGKCMICHKIEDRRTGKGDRMTRLCVDHCHKTGKVRGLLCFDCNILLGKAKDSNQILTSAINYLNAHTHKEAI